MPFSRKADAIFFSVEALPVERTAAIIRDLSGFVGHCLLRGGMDRGIFDYYASAQLSHVFRKAATKVSLTFLQRWAHRAVHRGEVALR